jgi:2',3'-cyclic-nucleotide 2'-phosphodiesterase (5'-nucleotidase family)
VASSASSDARRRALKLAAAALVAGAALCVPAVTTATTVPTKTILVSVQITDARIILVKYQNAISGNGTPEYLLLNGSVPRGDFLKFIVLNRGKRKHDFTVFGKTTKPIKPGGKVQFNKYAKVRGKFAYRSTLDKGKAFRGTIVVA